MKKTLRGVVAPCGVGLLNACGGSVAGPVQDHTPRKESRCPSAISYPRRRKHASEQWMTISIGSVGGEEDLRCSLVPLVVAAR
jgi:hypothetical protein